MPSQPEGQKLSDPYALPSAVSQGDQAKNFSVYLHVPYCRVRCGYCDFNTYTNLTMGPGANAGDYPQTLAAEARLVAGAMQCAGLSLPPASTVFIGGGTPTMLAAKDLAAMVDTVAQTWGLSDDVEITTEANPETVDAPYLQALASAGFTRVSFGMQSAVPAVLKTLDRTHTPARVPQVVAWAKQAGLQTSVDLIYGSPGESLADWRLSLEAAVAMEPDHISAYALVIEPGTKMWGQVRRGELPMPSDDDEASKYELADQLLKDAGYNWYEISNWARPGYQCRHNQAYWRQDTFWWGLGPGAHSYLGAARLWNTKHPLAWANQINSGQIPVAGWEHLGTSERATEVVMLAVRTRAGLDIDQLRHLREDKGAGLSQVVAKLIATGLIEPRQALAGRIVLTLSGRLLADGVTSQLLGW